MPDHEVKKTRIKELLKKIKENDLTALNELINLKSSDIQVIAYNIIKDRALAEDIVNEVIISLIENIHHFDLERNLNGWINAVAINKSIDLVRKKRREVFFEEAIAKNENCIEDAIIGRLSVLEILSKMEDIERQVLVEKIINRANYEDISVKYEITYKQARRVFKSAKQNFTSIYIKNTKK